MARKPNPDQPWGGSRATRIRAQLQEQIDRGEGICLKCGRGVLPGHLWDVDHRVSRHARPDMTWDMDNLGVAHRSCNRAAGARQTNSERGYTPRPVDRIPKPSRDW